MMHDFQVYIFGSSLEKKILGSYKIIKGEWKHFISFVFEKDLEKPGVKVMQGRNKRKDDTV